MAFRIRDLMISVLPSAGGGGYGCPTCTGTTGQVGGCNLCTGTTGQIGCPTCTGTTNPQLYGELGFGCPTCTGTTGQVGGCNLCTGTTGQIGCQTCTGTTGNLFAHAAALAACGACTGFSPAIGDQRPQALAALRQQLQGLLDEVEAEEKRLDEAAFPKTADEAEELEKRLEEALAEVRSRKAGLKKKKG
jgi:hypothetical protein